MTQRLEIVTPDQGREILRRAGFEVMFDGKAEEAALRERLNHGHTEELDAYALVPLDWESDADDDAIDWLEEPYFPRGARIWLWGETGSAKSMFALWVGCKLSRRGLKVVYFSEENPTNEDKRRLRKLNPTPRPSPSTTGRASTSLRPDGSTPSCMPRTERTPSSSTRSPTAGPATRTTTGP
jgi:AAA domain